MKNLVVASLSVIPLAMFAWQASAQTAEEKRDLAIRTCMLRVMASTGGQTTGSSEDLQSQRVALFKACMTSLGERP